MFLCFGDSKISSQVCIISPRFRYALDLYSLESRLLSRAGISVYKSRTKFSQSPCFPADGFARYAASGKPPAKTFAKPQLALPREPRRVHAHRRGAPDGLLRSDK